MNIHLWWCPSINKWRYTVVNNSRPILKQESGQRDELWEALNEVKCIVKKLYV